MEEAPEILDIALTSQSPACSLGQLICSFKDLHPALSGCFGGGVVRISMQHRRHSG